PSNVAKADPAALQDRAVSWTYEPGSTMKAITIAAAIDQHVVTPNTTYDDKGYAVIGGRVLHNALDKSYGVSTVTQIPEHSANGGTLYRPYVVAARRDADGEHRTAPVAVRHPITPETAATLRAMLISTVDNGIASGAQLKGYSVAGKTGTAQIPSEDGRYLDDA